LIENKHDVIRVSTTLINQLTLDIRGLIAMSYEGVMSCDDPACGRRTRQITVRGANGITGGVACLANKCQGKMYPRYSSAELYAQLMYYSTLFDVAHARDALVVENKRRRDAALISLNSVPLPQLSGVVSKLHEEVLANVHAYVDGVLERNAYCYVQLSSIFNTKSS
jgi:DNA polymerase alpha subunit A